MAEILGFDPLAVRFLNLWQFVDKNGMQAALSQYGFKRECTMVAPHTYFDMSIAAKPEICGITCNSLDMPDIIFHLGTV